MRLRTFESYWLVRNGIMNSYPSLQHDEQTEVLVIGGGITGALVSHYLVKAGYKVILIDKRDIGQGSSSATTSLLQYEIDVNLYDLCNMIGEEAAVDCYKAGIDAIKKIEKIVTSEKMNCGFKLKKSLYFAHDRKHKTILKKEFEIRDKHDLGVKWLNEADIMNKYGLKSYGGILSKTAASMDAYMLAHKLIALNVNRGMFVYDQTEAVNIDYKGPVKVTTDTGYIIISDTIVFCSGFETLEIIGNKYADIFSTFACISEQSINLSNKFNKLICWDTHDPYYYFRTTDDGRLLIGGLDEDSNSNAYRENNKEKKAKRLKRYIERVIPGTKFIDDFDWAGTFGSTKDGLPYIGKHKLFPNSIFVLGFGGNGITFSLQGAQLTVKLLKGETDKRLEYYRFDR